MASIDEDYLLALQLQEEENNNNIEVIKSNDVIKKEYKNSSVVDPSWELIDPNPDIHALFLEFNKKYFWDNLLGCEVRWSPRMTLCAGLCSYERLGGFCSIRLSQPLLKLRPRKDLIQTLLHEMIHAYLFVTHNRRDREDHGPEFCKHMDRINKESGANVTIYHTFHDEVKFYQQHWWKCNGPCQSRHPYYGLVKRAMNRAPGPNDTWWREHQLTCGGTFTKIKEPDKADKKRRKDSNSPDAPQKKKTKVEGLKNFTPFSGKGFTLGNNTMSSQTSLPIKTLGSINSGNSNSSFLNKNKASVQKPITNFLISPSKTTPPKDILKRVKSPLANFRSVPSSSKIKGFHNSSASKSNGWKHGMLKQRQNSASTITINGKKTKKGQKTTSTPLRKISELPPPPNNETLHLRKLLRRKWSLDSNNDTVKEPENQKERRHSFSSNVYRIRRIITSDSEGEDYLKGYDQIATNKGCAPDEDSEEDDFVFADKRDRPDKGSLITNYLESKTAAVKKENSSPQLKPEKSKYLMSGLSKAKSNILNNTAYRNLTDHVSIKHLNNSILKSSSVASGENNSAEDCILLSEWDKIKITETKPTDKSQIKMEHSESATEGKVQQKPSSISANASFSAVAESSTVVNNEDAKPVLSDSKTSLEDCECPLCNKPVKFNLINDHLDMCIIAMDAKNEEKSEIVTSKNPSTSSIEEQVSGNSSFAQLAEDLSNLPARSNSFNCCDCPVCNKPVPFKEINSHLDTCISTI